MTKKSNNGLYTFLLLASLIILGLSFCFSSTDRGFTLLSSLGCSGIVSVLVAWLIERANEQIQKNHDRQIVEMLLNEFDSKITAEMQRALLACARSEKFNFDKSYSIQEIRAMLEKIDSSDVYFKGFSYMVERGLNAQLPLAVLSFENSDEGMSLYTHFKALDGFLSEIQTFEKETKAVELVKFFVLGTYGVLNDIYKSRCKEPTYEMPSDTKRYLISLKATIDSKKEKVPTE